MNQENSQEDLEIIFESFPEEIQKAMFANSCDFHSFKLGKLSTALYKDYENAKNRLLPLCQGNGELENTLLDYLWEVFP